MEESSPNMVSLKIAPPPVQGLESRHLNKEGEKHHSKQLGGLAIKPTCLVDGAWRPGREAWWWTRTQDQPRSRHKEEAAGVAPRQSSRLGLVLASQKGWENSGYRQSWGEVGVAGFLVSSLAKGGASTRMNKAKPWSNDCRTIRYEHCDGIFSIRRCTYDITIL